MPERRKPQTTVHHESHGQPLPRSLLNDMLEYSFTSCAKQRPPTQSQPNARSMQRTAHANEGHALIVTLLALLVPHLCSRRPLAYLLPSLLCPH